jgi:DNA-binding MarR family transcriptional regulator
VVLTTGGITRLVDRMIAAGLGARVPSPNDRRVYFAELTARGGQTLEQAATVHAKNLRVVFAGLSRQELGMLDALLDRLRNVDLHLT